MTTAFTIKVMDVHDVHGQKVPYFCVRARGFHREWLDEYSGPGEQWTAVQLQSAYCWPMYLFIVLHKDQSKGEAGPQRQQHTAVQLKP